MWIFKKDSQQSNVPQPQAQEIKQQNPEKLMPANPQQKKNSLFSGMSVRKNKPGTAQKNENQDEEGFNVQDSIFKKDQVEKSLEGLNFDILPNKKEITSEPHYTLPVTLEQIRQQEKYSPPPETSSKPEDIQKQILKIKEEIEQEKQKQKEIQLRIEKQLSEDEADQFISSVTQKVQEISNPQEKVPEYLRKNSNSTQLQQVEEEIIEQVNEYIPEIQKFEEKEQTQEQVNQEEEIVENQESFYTPPLALIQQQQQEEEIPAKESANVSYQEQLDPLAQTRQRIVQCLEAYKECFVL